VTLLQARLCATATASGVFHQTNGRSPQHGAGHASCADPAVGSPGIPHHFNRQETTMEWTRPQYQDLRFGFEITMYISNR